MIQDTPSTVPCLATAPDGPLLDLEIGFPTQRGKIGLRFRDRLLCPFTPFHVGADLRNRGLKPAPVDTTLIPAGFDRRCPKVEFTRTRKPLAAPAVTPRQLVGVSVFELRSTQHG